MFKSLRFNTIDNLVVIYGLDGSGKTTQALKVKEKLESKGYAVHHIQTPSDSVWGVVQKRLLARKEGGRKRAAVFGFFDFLSLMPCFESARRTDAEIKRFTIEDLHNGYLDDIVKRVDRANECSKVVYIMERHPLTDVVAYFGPEIRSKGYYRLFSFLFPKPGLAIRTKVPPEQALIRVVKRGEPLEETESLDALIEADGNFDEVSIGGTELVEVDTSDERDEDESAEEIVGRIKGKKKKTESKIRAGVKRAWGAARDILEKADDYFRREEEE